jgi:hypothetical protein
MTFHARKGIAFGPRLTTSASRGLGSAVRPLSTTATATPAAAAAAPSAPAEPPTPASPSAANGDKKPSIWGFSLAELSEELQKMGMQAWKAKSLFTWLYHHGVTDVNRMTDFSKTARPQLLERFDFALPATVGSHDISVDGTQKWLLNLQSIARPNPAAAAMGAASCASNSAPPKPAQAIETVFIPAFDPTKGRSRAVKNPQLPLAHEARAQRMQQRKEAEAQVQAAAEAADFNRGTLCVSSQVGCSLSCSFCHTGYNRTTTASAMRCGFFVVVASCPLTLFLNVLHVLCCVAFAERWTRSSCATSQRPKSSVK